MQSLLSQITIETDNTLGQMQARVALVTKNQDALDTFYDAGIPSSDLVGQGNKLRMKFVNLVSEEDQTAADRLCAEIKSLTSRDSINLQELTG